jgi:hypothetical protein
VLSPTIAGAAFAQEVVTAEIAVVTLRSSENPAGGDSLTFTASVATMSGGGVPGGTIQFIDESTMTVLGWADVAAPSITVGRLTPGRHLIRADYSGTADFLPLVVQAGQSALLTQTVLATPDITLSSSQNPSEPGELVTLTAVVTCTAGTPKGAVTFNDAKSVIASHVALDRDGIASFTTSALADGNSTIVAIYEGDGEHASAVSEPFVQDVGAARIHHTMLVRER